MEFGEKIKKLRIENNWTQEQVAQKLYISRTAISKWESGKGYPNIGSLKDIAKLYHQSIDDLLSNEEILVLAESESKNNVNIISVLIYGMLDSICALFIFLPIYAQRQGNDVISTSLFNSIDATNVIKFSYTIVLLLMTVIGILEILLIFTENKKGLKLVKIASMVIQTISVLIFAVSRQPYLTSCFFILLLIKALITFQGLSDKKRVL